MVANFAAADVGLISLFCHAEAVRSERNERSEIMFATDKSLSRGGTIPPDSRFASRISKLSKHRTECLFVIYEAENVKTVLYNMDHMLPEIKVHRIWMPRRELGSLAGGSFF